VENRTYNDMFQLARITAPGVEMRYAYPPGMNNGQITLENEVFYTYDSLKRLVKAETTGPEWGQAFAYDGFGNMT
jgi:hypothetical protein